MQNLRRNIGQWLRYNWLELLLVLILLAALAWLLRTGSDLLTMASPQPTGAPAIGATPSQPSEREPTTTPIPIAFDGQQAQAYAGNLLALGPRPSGSAANRAAADFIAAELRRLGWEVEEQIFERGEGVVMRNVIGKAGPLASAQGQEPTRRLIASTHFDTTPAASRDPDPAMHNQPSWGANDGASGAAVLLALARSLDRGLLGHEVWLAFLDGEAWEPARAWNYGPGAQEMSQRWPNPPASVIALNMVGGAGQQLYYEATSDTALRQEIWALADQLGYANYFIPEPRHAITDGLAARYSDIPIVNIIDLDYPYWDTSQDTADKLDLESLERVGRVLEAYVEQKR